MLRTIGVITIIAAVTLVIGFAAGWFTFSSESRAGDTQLTFRVDREEVQNDVEDVKNRVTRDSASPPNATELEPTNAAVGGTMTGEVLSVEPSNARLELRLDSGGERSLVVAAESAAGLGRVKPGDRVELTTVVEQGRERIIELRVL
jgi:hypothetical protein